MSYLVANPEDSFSCDVAPCIIVVINYTEDRIEKRKLNHLKEAFVNKTAPRRAKTIMPSDICDKVGL